MQRLQGENAKGYNPSHKDKANSSGPTKPAAARSHVQQIPRAESKPAPVYEDPTFSLGVDFLDMDDNWDDDDDDNDAVTDAASPELKSKSDIQPKRNTSASVVNSVSNRTLNESNVSDRERRLQLSRQRQEEFRRKMAIPSTSTSTSRQSSSHFGSQIHPPSQSPQVTTTRQSDLAPTPSPAPTQSQNDRPNDQSLVTPDVRNSHSTLLSILQVTV